MVTKKTLSMANLGQAIEEFWELGSMTIKVHGIEKTVGIMDYIEAKTKDLKEFGYGSLTEKEVTDSLKRVLTNTIQKSNVIDLFVSDDVTLK